MLSFLVLLAVILFVVFYVIQSNDRSFNQMVDDEITTLFESSDKSPVPTYTETDLEGLPALMQNYLRRCLKDGQLYMRTATLKQSGEMSVGPDQPWKTFTADQYFSLQPPAFLWKARMAFLPMIWIKARDKYMNQQGNMLIKMMSALTVADAKDPKTSEAAWIRYLAEMIWFPTAFIEADFIQWEVVDDHSVRMTAEDRGVKGSVIFQFNDAGDIEKVISRDRYMRGDDAAPTLWYGTVSEYREFNGVRIPSEIEVGWEPESGYWGYWRGKIETINYNFRHGA